MGRDIKNTLIINNINKGAKRSPYFYLTLRNPSYCMALCRTSFKYQNSSAHFYLFLRSSFDYFNFSLTIEFRWTRSILHSIDQVSLQNCTYC